MSLASGTVNNSAIDNLLQSSLESENEYFRRKWIPCEEISDVKSTQLNNVYYASCKETLYGQVEKPIMLLCLGNNEEECTPTLVSEFARIYSLPTHKYNKDDNQFRRYSVWLEKRNKLIKGFTKYNDTITWLLRDAFTMVILSMDSALNVKYSDVVPCGVFAAINKYPMDGLATTNDSMSLSRKLNYKQT